MAEKESKSGDLKDSHFSRYGEFLVSYELSKRGWNVYGPVYDEYVDYVVSGFICENGDCRSLLRTVTPRLVCPCGKELSNAEKKKCQAVAVCVNCNEILVGNEGNSRCKKCRDSCMSKRERFLACPRKCECERLTEKKVQVQKSACQLCGSENISMVFRTVQVKSSRMEDGGTYAVNHKPRDLVPDMKRPDQRHFFVWCMVDEKDRATFFVVSAPEFAETMGRELFLPSFLKDDGREHFRIDQQNRWKDFKGAFDKMRWRLEGDPPPVRS